MDELFFANHTQELKLYRELAKLVLNRFDGVQVIFHKTQITFKARYGFAFVSLPMRRSKRMPENGIVVSFGLCRMEKSPRIAFVANPYPNRYTHHVAVATPADIDDELLNWLEEAYAFSQWGRGKISNVKK